MRKRWERFRQRKADEYGSFYEYADLRGSQVVWVLVAVLTVALVVTAMMPLPGVAT